MKFLKNIFKQLGILSLKDEACWNFLKMRIYFYKMMKKIKINELTHQHPKTQPRVDFLDFLTHFFINSYSVMLAVRRV
jgi:hypothetical protein